MAPQFSKFLTKNNAYVAAGAAVTLWLAYSMRSSKAKRSSQRKVVKKIEEEIKYTITEDKKQQIKAHINLQFFRRFFRLFKIAVPGCTSYEAGLMFLVGASLVFRSICDLWIIQFSAKIESSIISMNRPLFIKRLFQFLLVMPLVSVVNNMLKYSSGELNISIRKNLTSRLYEEYFKKSIYYHIGNLDNRIVNVDQLLTNDVDKFSESTVDLYCNIAKPILDIGIYVYKLGSNLSFHTPALMLCYLFVSGFILTSIRKPTGRLTVTEQKYEGEFRHVNSRIITYSEEIAFYQGNHREKVTVLTSFAKLINHSKKFLRFRVIMGIIDNIIAKYFAIAVGFWTVSRPFLSSTHDLAQYDLKERSRLYYTYGGMLVRLGQAIGRLVLAGRELTKLSGFTFRITQLREVLADLEVGKYQRTMVMNSDEFKSHNGRLIFKNNIIKFDRVPIVTPNGDVLIRELSVEIQSGMNVLVCGPNGSGKSSIFRILGELWPLFGGELTKPPRGKLFYVPQKPYMTLGTLRDQIIYPFTVNQAARRGGCTDEKLIEYLKQVQLEYLLEREGGLDAVADWLDVLSGGEKQRVAMARLFYHAPQFAILDECTSAVSIDVEGSMYRHCRKENITLLTVSHRKSLWQHHEYVLYLNGRGSYSFKPIENDTEQFGS